MPATGRTQKGQRTKIGSGRVTAAQLKKKIEKERHNAEPFINGLKVAVTVQYRLCTKSDKIKVAGQSWQVRADASTSKDKSSKQCYIATAKVGDLKNFPSRSLENGSNLERKLISSLKPRRKSLCSGKESNKEEDYSILKGKLGSKVSPKSVSPNEKGVTICRNSGQVTK
ncbi:hypothetical protein K435DRAFT_808044 [Dendrothele bispora CBS 962.96]|uniref:Uncharacterized protein n=1 Tax=Dendrothele bispora (strain CBS 962.96) TaxID=1314807 RepID=A0A4S8L2Q6_DENBC|nr:hypothetical protein K435DRAFT_808044 [Dendrothele bispora CBS 962.96]